MATLAFQKCLNHGEREAVARCPQCRSHFCRECVSEHQGRILCAQCLAKASAKSEAAPAWARVWIPLASLAGLAMAWGFFLVLGKTLLLIPSSFHDGAWADEAADRYEETLDPESAPSDSAVPGSEKGPVE